MSAVEGFLLGGDPAQGTPIVPRAVICIFACGGNFVAFAFDGPTPGSVSSWSDVAELRLISDVVAEVVADGLAPGIVGTLTGTVVRDGRSRGATVTFVV